MVGSQLLTVPAKHVYRPLVQAVEVLVETGLLDDKNCLPQVQHTVKGVHAKLREFCRLPAIRHESTKMFPQAFSGCGIVATIGGETATRKA